MTEQNPWKRLVGNIYSGIADNIYEPVVVQGAFRVFGRHLHDTIRIRGRRAADLAAGSPILDMPVGTGFFIMDTAAQHDGIVVGVDIADGMVREARSSAREAGVANLHVMRADAHHLPFATGSFAVVLCWNGLQVIPGIEPTVAELARVLAPGGTMFVSTVNLPLGDALTDRTGRRLPPIFSGRRRFEQALGASGLQVTAVEKDRLATIFTAEKPD